MNGIHDMGGMHGLGPIEREENEPVFHQPWEGRMFGISEAMTFPPGFAIDRFRFLRESMPPADYLSQSYYEHWYFVCAAAMLEAGMATMEELRSGRAAPGFVKRGDALRAADVVRGNATWGIFEREAKEPPRFGIGQSVRTRNIHPAGHTRLPRYARGKAGVIHRHCGAHVFPDTKAHGLGENPHPLYSVAFAARELWGDDAPAKDKVFLDLWERYLEPA
jgi:nitrile hydratase